MNSCGSPAASTTRPVTAPPWCIRTTTSVTFSPSFSESVLRLERSVRPVSGNCAGRKVDLATVTMNTPAGRSENPNVRSEEHTSELQSQFHLVCRLLLEKKKKKQKIK